jgi:regulator of telomere elongation helicase 1
VNQALGRVIRHRHDFGAIILLDERFHDKGMQNELSKWLRPSVNNYDAFGKVTHRHARGTGLRWWLWGPFVEELR